MRCLCSGHSWCAAGSWLAATHYTEGRTIHCPMSSIFISTTHLFRGSNDCTCTPAVIGRLWKRREMEARMWLCLPCTFLEPFLAWKHHLVQDVARSFGYHRFRSFFHKYTGAESFVPSLTFFTGGFFLSRSFFFTTIFCSTTVSSFCLASRLVNSR